MKVLIILENHFIRDIDGNVWCDRVVDYNYLKRYLNVFENIVVCGRFSHTSEKCDNKLLVSGKNVEFIELPDFRGIKGIIRNYFKIRKVISNSLENINCVIMRAPTHLAFISYRIIKKSKIPFAIEFMMAADKMVEAKGVIGKVINTLLVREAQRMCKDANGVSYVTEKILQKTYVCKSMISDDNNFFTENYSSIDLLEEYFYEQPWDPKDIPPKFRIIHTGYMDSYRKGQDTLIKAIKEVIAKGYNNIEVVLIGDGEKREEFEQLAYELNISEYINFKGLIRNKKDIFEELKKSHIFVFPTHSEGLPRSIIEAMAVGLACISSPVDGIPELLEEEYLVPFDNVQGYSNKIIELINDWEKIINNGKRNYMEAQKYEAKKIMKRRTEFYKKLKKQAK